MIRGLFKLSRTGVVFGLKQSYKDKTFRTLYAVSIGKDAFQILLFGNRAEVGEMISGLLLFSVITGYLAWRDYDGIFIKLDIGYKNLIEYTKKLYII